MWCVCAARKRCDGGLKRVRSLRLETKEVCCVISHLLHPYTARLILNATHARHAVRPPSVSVTLFNTHEKFPGSHLTSHASVKDGRVARHGLLVGDLALHRLAAARDELDEALVVEPTKAQEAGDSEAVESARSSTRGSGWTPSGPLSPLGAPSQPELPRTP